jgi:hypothetical protein
MTLDIPKSIDANQHEMEFFKAFLQGMTNRRFVGALRYGLTKKRTKFLTRMKMEVAAYERTGNMEQLLNIANYCYLEAYAPENPKFHWDPKVDSVTRGKI